MDVLTSMSGLWTEACASPGAPADEPGVQDGSQQLRYRGESRAGLAIPTITGISLQPKQLTGPLIPTVLTVLTSEVRKLVFACRYPENGSRRHSQ
jgi:hypothetical protein